MKKIVDMTEAANQILILGVLVSLTKEQYKTLLNPSRNKLINIIAQEKEPISLMELSRKSDFSKTNTEHHIKILKDAEILEIKNSNKKQHNPLLISLTKSIKSQI